MRHYDNERLGRYLVKEHRYRRQRRAAMGFRYSSLEPLARKLGDRPEFTRQDELRFTDDDGE